MEGDSSLTAHSVFANDLLRKIVDQDSSLDMQDTVDTLRVLVDAMKRQPAANEMTYPNAKVVLTPAAATLRACQLPPIQKTVYILKFAKCEAPSHFHIAGWSLTTLSSPSRLRDAHGMDLRAVPSKHVPRDLHEGLL